MFLFSAVWKVYCSWLFPFVFSHVRLWISRQIFHSSQVTNSHIDNWKDNEDNAHTITIYLKKKKKNTSEKNHSTNSDFSLTYSS